MMFHGQSFRRGHSGTPVREQIVMTPSLVQDTGAQTTMTAIEVRAGQFMWDKAADESVFILNSDRAKSLLRCALEYGKRSDPIQHILA